MAMVNPYNYSKPISGVAVNNKSVGSSAKLEVVKATPASSSSDKYLEQKIMAAKPEELTLMLYDGIIKFVSQAKLFNDQKNIEKSNGANMRAQAILEELRATLDLTYEVSESLESLYIFMIERLVEANVGKDNAILDEVLELATDLRNTWKEAMGL